MSTTLLPELAPVETATPGPGVVYTETLVWSPPEQFLQDAPYQLAIVEFDNGERLTGRITGQTVKIGDPVDFAEFRNGIPFFRKTA
jgi:uncharacterized OB-fold protein